MRHLAAVLAACSRVLIAGILWIGVRLFHKIEFHGLEHLPARGPVYFAMAHKRDVDPMIEVPTILARWSWRAVTRDVLFAIRSDAFAPRFLSRVVPEPGWLSRLLGLLSLGGLLRFIGLRPIENIHLRPIELWLRNALQSEGDRPAGEILSPAFLQQWAHSAGEQAQRLAAAPLSRLLSWHYRTILRRLSGAEIFQPEVYLRVKNRVLEELRQQLTVLSAWLARGGSLWGAPEGQLSPDGRVGPITAAPHRLLRGGPPETRVVPIAIMYDFMTVRRRKRVFVSLAPSIERAPQLPQRELHEHIRRAWLLSAHFTCTQLASGFLVQRIKEGRSSFTLDELVVAINRQALQLKRAGRHVDRRLLKARSVRRLARHYLKYAAHRQLVRRTGRRTWKATIGSLSIQVGRGEPGYRQAPLAYAWNELQDLLSVGLTSAASISAASTSTARQRGQAS
ncbi:MAG: hypothetical protein IRZ31_08895 [Thermogemmatispora sp.]|uniref:hypothetical protein n=1 Tax=Thermogemmatispora sp. TaxID=1968838 RepID=UPI002620DDCB|nr:hypothetical protein [Thermogemmatispora sp.]MBX5457005.1 hypothetical protein [Thermogemmatispora sp.]